MKQFLARVAAGLVSLAVFVLILLGAVYLKVGRGPEVKGDSILQLSVGGPILEYPVGGVTGGLLSPAGHTLQGYLTNLDKAAVDDRIKGVLITLESPGTGYAALGELRDKIAQVRAAGKPVWAWADMVDLKSLYVASACDSFYVQPAAFIEVTGMWAGMPHIKSALDKLGIQPQIHRIKDYKSAAELATRTDMSPQTREMELWILNDIYPHVIGDIAAGFGTDTTAVTTAMQETQLLPDRLVELGLADGSRYWDEMKGALPRPRGKEEPRLLAGADYRQVKPASVGLKGGKTIAVVHAQGLIGGTRSGENPLLGPTMGHESVNRDLRRAMEDDDVAAVVFRIDSGGGSSLTSDRISRMVAVVNARKPVVVSMVDVAASGGYAIAYPARTLIADGNTITGSIGSITGKLVTRDFQEKLGVTRDGVGVGPEPDFNSSWRPWTPAEYEKVEKNHWQDYNRWVQRIADQRNLTFAQVDSVARGRVWTGRQALERKLIDRLGNLDDAVAAAKEAAGIAPGEKVTVVHYPQPEGLLAQILGAPVGAVSERLVSRALDRARTGAAVWNRGEMRILEMPVP